MRCSIYGGPRVVYGSFRGGQASDRPNERTPTAHSRCIQNAPHDPHAHPTPKTNTKLKYLPSNIHVLNLHLNSGSARSLKALFPPHPPGPVHIVLAHLPLPPPLSVCTWTQWYAAARSYAAWLGSALMSGERESRVRERMREEEFGGSLAERCAWLNTGRRW